MTAIPFPLNSDASRTVTESAGQLINCFVRGQLEGAPSKLKYLRSAGITELANSSAIIDTHCRGLAFVGNVFSGPVVFVIYDNAIYIMDFNSENTLKLGSIPGTSPVTIATNARSPTPDVALVTEFVAYQLFYNPASAPIPYPSPNLSTLVTSVCSHNGYFIFTALDGKIQASDLNSVNINSLSFTTARGSIVRGVSFLNDFIAFGKDFFEIYRDVGTQPFPLAFVDRVACGLQSPFGVAGFETGGPGELIWVADDDTVVQYQGTAQPKVISTSAVSQDIRLSNVITLEAYTYGNDGDSFWVLNNPGAGGWTWEYNITTQRWNRRKSTGRDEWRVSQIVRQPPVLGIPSFPYWIVGDRTTGLLGKIDPRVFTEYGVETELEIQSGITPTFPANLGIPRVDFNLATESASVAPEVNISWSDNGGKSFSTPVIRTIPLSDSTNRERVTVLRTGIAKGPGRRFKLTMTDPGNFILMGGDMTVQERGKG